MKSSLESLHDLNLRVSRNFGVLITDLLSDVTLDPHWA